MAPKPSDHAPSPAPSGWVERDKWVRETKEVYDYTLENSKRQGTTIRTGIAQQLADHLVSGCYRLSQAFI